MKTLANTVLFLVAAYVLPLTGRIDLLLDWRILILMAAGATILLTQPQFSVGDAREKQATDSFTVFLILGCGLLSQVVPVIEYAYFERLLPDTAATAATLLGLAMLIGGLAFRIWSIRTLGKYFTSTVQITEGHKLVTWGPYAIVRHPSYLGAWVAIIGAGVFLAAPIGTLTAAILMSLAYRKRLAAEEQTLRARFGAAYDDYSATTPRVIPLESILRFFTRDGMIAAAVVLTILIVTAALIIIDVGIDSVYLRDFPATIVGLE